MNFSVSIQTDNGDRYYLYLAPLFDGFKQDLHLPEEDVEVYQIVLDREKGTNTTDMKILSQISDFLAKIILSNRNIIMYYVCDDMNEIPNSNHSIPSQEYRSKLFSVMFSRYKQRIGAEEIIDTPVIIKDAVGNNQYIHIIAGKEHSASVGVIIDFIIEGYAVGK